MKYPLVYTQNASSQWIAVEKMLKSRFRFASILWFTLILWSAPSSAQQAEYLWSIENSLWVGPAVGEDYILEISGGLWNPHGNIAISSQQFGIAGSNIDFRQDLGLKRQVHPQVSLRFKPSQRHKLRMSTVPIQYEQQSTLKRALIFNGISFTDTLPVTSLLELDTWRFGYEYDVVSRSRGFIGVLAETTYTKVRTELRNDKDTEYSSHWAPIPSVGGIARVYITRFTPITAEVSAFVLPDNLSNNYQAQYLDIDIYATLNLSRMVGMTLGYRSFDLSYVIQSDTGTLKLEGFYLSGQFRF